VQNLQVFLGCPLRLLFDQHIVGQPKATAGKQIVAVAVIDKGPWLTHQPVNDVPVLDAMLASST
jgi:hypothetical protein